MSDEINDLHAYGVVVHHEEQCSIWRADRELPPGWRKVEKKRFKRRLFRLT